jgi:hypothetical protein
MSNVETVIERYSYATLESCRRETDEKIAPVVFIVDKNLINSWEDDTHAAGR